MIGYQHNPQPRDEFDAHDWIENLVERLQASPAFLDEHRHEAPELSVEAYARETIDFAIERNRRGLEHAAELVDSYEADDRRAARAKRPALVLAASRLAA